MPTTRKPFDFRWKPPYPSRHQEGKPLMTIAIGFRCPEGIVLCTDRQITDYGSNYKYSEQKIYPIVGRNWCVACAYAGYRNIMKAVQTKFERRLNSETNPNLDFIENCLTGILAEVKKVNRKQVESQQMFCAMSAPEGERLLQFQADLASEVSNGQWEVLGAGDSSLIRYLIDVTGVRRARMSASQALLIGFYMVSKANTYIPGCKDGPDLAFVRRGGCETSSQLDRSYYALPEVSEQDLADTILALTQCFDFKGERLTFALQTILDKSPRLRDWMRKVVGRMLPTMPQTDEQKG